MKEILKVFKALSDETRLRVVNLLLMRECCVCEVMQALDISQSKASRALGALHDAGILSLRKDGLWSLYSIKSDSSYEYLSVLIESINRDIGKNQQLTLDRERLKQAERVGPSCVSR
jgi:ArsR family transcriptional regulator